MFPPSAEGGNTPGDLHLRGLTKRFGDTVAVAGVDLHVPQGSFFALLGPSGCGKTTTLRMVAGLEEPTDGRVLLGGRDVTAVPAHRRPVNTVFQSYALFPHLDVAENVAFGLRRRGVRDVRRRVADALDLVGLADLGRRRPRQLSGGQQQRVALARALVNEPAVLLLDEPLGALDLQLRRQMQVQLKRIQREVGTTFVHVTHDQEEAMTMADTVAVMRAGRVEQLGMPSDLYELPATVFVAGFLGSSNLLAATRTGSDGDLAVFDVHGSAVPVPRSRVRSDLPRPLLGVRPEKLRLAGHGDPLPTGSVALTGGVVTDTSFAGVSTEHLVRMPWGQELQVFTQNTDLDPPRPRGTAVTVYWRPEHAFVLAPEDGMPSGTDGPAGGAAATVPVTVGRDLPDDGETRGTPVAMEDGAVEDGMGRGPASDARTPVVQGGQDGNRVGTAREFPGANGRRADPAG